jgi:hypothetical protein
MDFWIYFQIILTGLIVFGSCKAKKEQGNGADSLTGNQADTSVFTNEKDLPSDIGAFEGEYMFGDGTVFIVPAKDGYEIQDEKGGKTGMLYFIRKENDTVQVFGTKDGSQLFKMNPGFKTGIYVEKDEKWEIHYVGPIKKFNTEEEETEELFKKRHIEDSIAYTELSMYDGTYAIQTESDGVNANLRLKYKKDRTFAYEWQFIVENGDANCAVKRKGVLAMDRTQHGIDREGECLIHFNFNGFWNGRYVVELEFEDQAKCKNLKGDYTFSGTYVKK